MLALETAATLSDFVRLTLRLATTDFTLYRGQSQSWPLRPKLVPVKQGDGISKVSLEAALVKDFKKSIFGIARY
jgi:hypothetical protein